MNNSGGANGGNGFSDATARISGYQNGLLELKGTNVAIYGPVKFDSDIDLSGKAINNLSAGVIAATGTQAVNGAQLYATNNAVVTALGGNAKLNADGTIAGPRYAIGGSSFNTIGGALTNLDTRVSLNNSDINTTRTNLATLDSVAAKYDDTSMDTLTLGGKEGTKVTNLQDATLSSTSTDAVTGRQLNATKTDLTDLTQQINDGTIGLVQRDAKTSDINVATATDGTKVNFAGKSGDRLLSGVAAGGVNATSNQAVNGSQLHATNDATAKALGTTLNEDGTIAAPSYKFADDSTFDNVDSALGNLDGRVVTNTQDITQNKTDITNLNRQINDGTIGLVQQDATTGNLTVGKGTGGDTVDFTGTQTKTDADGKVWTSTSSRTLTGVKAGSVSESSVDAINGSQLYGTAKSTAEALGGDSMVNADGTVTASYSFKDGTKFTDVGGALGNLDDRVTTNTTSISTLTNQINNGSVGLVQQDATTGDLTVGKNTGGDKVDFTGTQTKTDADGKVWTTTNARTLTGVAAGNVSATSTDAINGSQLYTTNAAVASTAEALGGGAKFNADGTFTKPTYTFISGSTFKDVGSALGDLDSRVAANSNNIATTETNIAVLTNQITTLGANAVQYDSDVHNKVTLGGIGAQTRVSLTNLQDGVLSETSTDAVTGAQLYATNKQLQDLNQRVTNTQVTGNSAISVNSTGVAAATGAEAVAVGGASQASGQNSVALGNGAQATGNNSVALGSGSIANQDNTVSVGSQGNERRITNVADGVAPTDAVNMRQFQDGVNSVARAAYSGVAAATALTMIPDVDPGKTLAIGIGTANFKGYQAGAIGASARVTPNVKVKVGAGMSAAGTTVGGGASYQW